MTVRIGSLFSGYGGLDLGVQAVFGGEVAWHVEFDAAPSKILAHHWPAVPNYGDITTVDWSQVEPVDILTGGFPCQDLSLAGRRAGMRDGTRSGLWSDYLKAIDVLRPGVVVIENVRGLLSGCAESEADSDLGPCPRCANPDSGAGHAPNVRALGRVLIDLARIGYVGRWAGVRAADAGAPHGRFRVFVVAYAHGSGLGSVGRVDALGRDADGRGREDRARDAGEPPAPAYASSHTGSVLDRDDVRARRGTLGRAPHAVASADADTSDIGHERPRIAWDRRARPADGGVTVADAAHDDSGRSTGARTEGRRAWVDARGRGRASAADARRSGGREGNDATRVGAEVEDGAGVAHERGARPGGTEWGVYGPAIRRWERVLGRPAPVPTLPDGKGGAHRLSARFVEFMMGVPAGHVTDPAIGLTRNEQLKALGNGVVPAQAALALSYLTKAAA